ncbi:peptidyl-alpha-hydroxyglycine alpha-amidating lyase family protein [Planctellipticum variicoloris]|uniref:peptidyl-alpha-hydroxyglycine alpha-amidating lyase family protein n=1 Tax=Planctellipticum variicoloris TaxID=3064265 RepID=UPI0030138FCE|nr:peptidyl-alpha-hydroxyglycine alpha-amidating lyase family protein [Planctomycetaceae bacterium SH412]
MGLSTLGLAALAGLLLGQADAAGPYESIGFVEIPAEVELGAMSAVAVDAHDQIYILHRGDLPILKFDSNGKYVKGWGQGLFKVPHGLRVGPDGAIWTTDNGNHVLRKFSPEGELLATIGREGKAAGGADGFRAPDDLVFDSKGQIYVADSGNGRIAKLDPSGKFLSQWGKKGKAPGEFATAHGLAIDKADRIYVADRGNQRVQVFEASGAHLADWSGFGNPFGLIVIGEELLASEGDKHLIVHFDRDGKITSKWGTPELLKLPHLMAVNSQGVLFVAEVNGKRIQKFRRK